MSLAALPRAQQVVLLLERLPVMPVRVLQLVQSPELQPEACAIGAR
ncbi:hypothetical protein BMETH_2303_0 [methanotrophic bacterial endosymbiont of Bathymodiolus sp.]|nr:hypothetical protein BMETH_2303_0 [methanotrophic bacterial endosymbiont of Bathymodiolus sp.]